MPIEDLGSNFLPPMASTYINAEYLTGEGLISCMQAQAEPSPHPPKQWFIVTCSFASISGGVGFGGDIVLTLARDLLQIDPTIITAYVSLTQSWDDVVVHTRPLQLRQGSHIWTTCDYWVKETFVSGAMAAIGISRVGVVPRSPSPRLLQINSCQSATPYSAHRFQSCHR